MTKTMTTQLGYPNWGPQCVTIDTYCCRRGIKHNTTSHKHHQHHHHHHRYVNIITQFAIQIGPYNIHTSDTLACLLYRYFIRSGVVASKGCNFQLSVGDYL